MLIRQLAEKSRSGDGIMENRNKGLITNKQNYIVLTWKSFVK